MQTLARSNFTTVKTEGAILPADLLQRIEDGQVDGLKPEDYHLAPNERISEAISRSWNRLLGVWEAFDGQRRQLDATDSGTSLTRERWLLILFQELGYGRLPFVRSIELEDGASYPISHLWEHVPIHLLTFRQELDRHDPAAKRSPHSLMQEFLNRSEDHLWGMVSNGLSLRVLRDNVSLTRAAYLEFDLEAMMEGQVYADFSLLWLIGHQSRVELGVDTEAPQTPANCWLELWSQEAVEQGTRALETLRQGVHEAIAALGSGFLAHPGNRALKEQLASGALNTQDYYRELLRLVYRLIFLFVAEDRDLLLVREATTEARQRYSDYYSAGRLRRLAEVRRGGPHPDLYRTLGRVFGLLREGYEPLGLPGLGSFLFSDRATPVLDEAEIANSDLLAAVRALAFTIEGRVLRPVDYKNLGAEELGSVYESLLELHPQLNVAAAAFALETAAGSERKTTGSYYTPTSLISSLLDSALEPVVADRLRGKTGQDAEAALLAIKVVDPAAGSGHFLIAAANRLATHLARIRTGDDEPSPADRRDALRDVVGKCIYGVDINEMAVELCKVALWMETLDPGRPLSFLEQHIQCGNSLIGATPALLQRGIPDEAFKAITGDEKSYVSEWKKRNKAQRSGQMDLLVAGTQPWDRLGNLAEALSRLEELEDGTLDGVQRQEETYAELVHSTEYEYGKMWADAWCAAFVWQKKPEEQGGFPYPITEQVFRRLEHNPYNEPEWLKDEIKRLAEEYQFFHWHLAFPQVFQPAQTSELSETSEAFGWTGGFDIVLGNPPWEKINLKDEEFFMLTYPEIAQASTKAKRKKKIAELKQIDPAEFLRYKNAQIFHDKLSGFFRLSGAFPQTGVSRINLYSVFAELAVRNLSSRGRLGLVIASGIATDKNNKDLFGSLVNAQRLICVWDFENRMALFPDVHRMYKFCLFCAGGVEVMCREVDFAFYLTHPQQLSDPDRHFTLSASDLKAINPETKTAPTFRNNLEARLTKEVYKNIQAWCFHERTEFWPGNPKTPFNMSNDSDLFETTDSLLVRGAELGPFNIAELEDDTFLPLYESKLMHQFNHRYSTYESGLQSGNDSPIELSKEDLSLSLMGIWPRYWIESTIQEDRYPGKWFLVYREITNASNERTAISTIIPGYPCGHTLVIMEDLNAVSAGLMCANMNSFVYDYTARQKVPGVHLNQWAWRQLPLPDPSMFITFNAKIAQVLSSMWFHSRILELVFTACDLIPFAQDLGYKGPPFIWSEDRRFHIRCELDAAFFHLYGIKRDDVDYIMDSFPIVRRKDEAAYGDYCSKRVILEIYDEMAEAMRTGQPFQTRLDPPPGDPRAAHPWDEEYLGPYKPPEEWWQEVEMGNGEFGMGNEGVRDDASVTAETAAKTIREPGPALELKSPPAAKKKKPKAALLSDQPSLISDFSPPKGGRSQRLKRVMALGQPKNDRELQELTAALGDEDGNIRWLAGSSLVRLRGHAVVAMLAAFLETNPGDPAQEEAQKVLSLIADADEDETVREAARKVLQ